MRVRLTETAITAAAKRVAAAGVREELSDDGMRGLRMRLTPAGARTWIWGGRDQDGKPRRIVVGHHPAMGISEAREAAGAMRGKVQQAGADPIAEARKRRKAARDAAEGVGTLAALLDLYGGPKPVKQATESAKAERRIIGPGGNLKSWPECRRRIEHVFAEFLDRPLVKLKAEELQLAADAHASPQSAAAAVRYLRPLLKWAAQRRYLAADVSVLHPPATVGRRDRVLSRDELAALLPELTKSASPYARALRFMLWTLARREEVGGARWRDVNIDAATWTIAATKNGQPHVVPLPRQAVAFLTEIKPDKADPTALVFGNGVGKALGNWDREAKAIMKDSGTKGWTRHDLRRTGATMLGDMGELPDIIEAALNHVAIRSPLAATYNRSRYRPQVAAALQRLADALDGIEAGAGLVVPLRKAFAQAV
jgi:integrase